MLSTLSTLRSHPLASRLRAPHARVVSLAVTLAPLVASALAAQTSRRPSTDTLLATPHTVAWGYYDAAAKPNFRIRSGDNIVVHTLITSVPKRLEAAGVPPREVQQSLRNIVDSVTDRGPGGHILTGPIYIEGADSGDVLELHIRKIALAIPYAYNAFGPKSGFIPEDFPYARMRIIPLDRKRMVADFAPGVKIPLHPFFGSIGVAPPAAMGRVSSAPPGIFAGNMDDRDLVAGTTLYIPVFTKGALLEIGDGHAGQGNGEVDITALETSLVGTFQVVVRKDMHLAWPMAETPTDWITMGMDRDLVTATKIAVRQAIAFLQTRGLSRDDAYMLTSTACDVDITELVDGNVGVHVLIPKRLFTRR